MPLLDTPALRCSSRAAIRHSSKLLRVTPEHLGHDVPLRSLGARDWEIKSQPTIDDALREDIEVASEGSEVAAA
jgi:hypothetical protein